ncbi:hypothetical protein F5876DRAFT_70136 [Lentinula aff. lateritia]|uniref:Uncharacterized protein n=1 Tax=Lentinula aff. lateritia TaxID=2804960 RepID=A0ACC1TKA9_9AGAR|nr:hypothetical protein F5876DRAFT_70136 [Lentinula aff. lateritia]
MKSSTLSSVLLASIASSTTLVNAAAWVAGYQSSGYTGWNLRQYTHLYEGNPREIAYIVGSDENTLPGAVCGSWTEWNIIGNSNPGQYEFNCVATVDDINNNARNNGFYVGGLNHAGETIALCRIEYSGSELCDSDTVTDADDRAATKSIQYKLSEIFAEYLPPEEILHKNLTEMLRRRDIGHVRQYAEDRGFKIIICVGSNWVTKAPVMKLSQNLQVRLSFSLSGTIKRWQEACGFHFVHEFADKPNQVYNVVYDSLELTGQPKVKNSKEYQVEVPGHL